MIKNPTNYNKFWVALVGVIIAFVNANTSISFAGIDNADIAVLVQGLTAIFVYQVPNVSKA